jgi:hypothetical protein
MNVGFFVRHFTERGTEVSVYDYATYNEDILHNKSLIICFTPEAQQRYHFPSTRVSYPKFSTRFTILEINQIEDMRSIIQEHHLAFFYTQTHGGPDVYRFQDSHIWGNCKTIKHCVFETRCPEGDFCISISKTLNDKLGTTLPVIPCTVYLPSHDENLRNELHIPSDAVVFGRYGGMLEFNIPMVHEAIREYVVTHENCYFLFMNTQEFYTHPRIIHVDVNVDLHYKTKFINTCDAMIHAREMGETFGLSVAEFSSKNKPILTCMSGDLEHVHILGEKAILYHSKEELIFLFHHIKQILQQRSDLNAYRSYSPPHVMEMFRLLFNTNKY